jgi:hypothetical protein
MAPITAGAAPSRETSTGDFVSEGKRVREGGMAREKARSVSVSRLSLAHARIIMTRCFFLSSSHPDLTRAERARREREIEEEPEEECIKTCILYNINFDILSVQAGSSFNGLLTGGGSGD